MTRKTPQNKGFQRTIRLRCGLFDGIKTGRAKNRANGISALTINDLARRSEDGCHGQYTDSESVFKSGFADCAGA